tara:strand:- start:8405 stop:8638 length:234 start_codon:yes stop_codon:yes gene_type:complete
MNIKVYSADWCSDCIAVKNFLKSQGVLFEEININNNIQATDFLERVNNGKRIIPTIYIDGKTYVNPGINALMKIIKE